MQRFTGIRCIVKNYLNNNFASFTNVKLIYINYIKTSVCTGTISGEFNLAMEKENPPPPSNSTNFLLNSSSGLVLSKGNLWVTFDPLVVR